MKTTRALSQKLLLFFCPLFAIAQTASEQAQNWPQEIRADGAKIVIYQPQPESLNGDMLEARAAVAVTRNGDDSPVFGAVWLKSRVATDVEGRTVTLLETQVTETKFPQGEAADAAQLAALVEKEIPKFQLVLSRDGLAGLDAGKSENSQTISFNNAPPEIIFRTRPTVLVLIDGEPRLKDIENSDMSYIENTPFLIIKQFSAYYLFGDGRWYRSTNLTGDWRVTNATPREVVELANEALTDEEKTQQEEADKSTVAPDIIVRTEPAELIQSDGEPEYAAVEGTQLLYMSNSENDIILDINTQTYYVLLAGRWYKSPSLLRGPWAFIANDKLPADFAAIPTDSDVSSVLPSVAGTDAAREALLENIIPQTAAVDRKTASLTVEYDGDPRFLPIENTNMFYAANTEKSVLKIRGRYYCCDDAVWFEGPSPKGPWQVCTQVPDDVQSIPPDVPVYNVRYVYIYDYTPEVVYVGYTPGYVHSYIYHGCVVYGTGWRYRPWYGHYYYARPVTWGFSVHYNPWSGWGFSWGYHAGWFYSDHHHWRHPHYGWWGPAGYHPGYRHGYHHGYHHGYDRGYYAGVKDGYQAGHQEERYQQRPSNIYRRRDVGVRETVDRTRRPTTVSSDRSSDGARFDRDGTVQRRTEQGRQQDAGSGNSRTRDRVTTNRTQDRATSEQTRERTTTQRRREAPSNRESTREREQTPQRERSTQESTREREQTPQRERSQQQSTRERQRDESQPTQREDNSRSSSRRERATPQQQQNPEPARDLEPAPQNRPRGNERARENQSQRRQTPPSQAKPSQSQPSQQKAKERQEKSGRASDNNRDRANRDSNGGSRR